MLGEKVDLSRRRLEAEKRRLRRAERALSERLVAIYESGEPSSASVILGSTDIDELTTRANYLERDPGLRRRPRRPGRKKCGTRCAPS